MVDTVVNLISCMQKSKCTNFGLVILLFIKLGYFDDLLVNAAKPAFLNHIVPGTKLLNKKTELLHSKKKSASHRSCPY